MHKQKQKAQSVFNLKGALSAKNIQRLFALAILAALLFVNLGFSVDLPAFPEYQRYVHTYVNDRERGNWTYLEKPMFPVYLNESQVPIGQNYTIVSPLQANHSYHIYIYGAWVHTGNAPKTDYDIYVYNP